MSAGTTNAKDKAALYWLGERLIDYRHPVSLLVILITAMFGYWAFQLKLETSFGDLLPQSHAFVKIHNKYAGTFGGANNIQLMVESTDGDIFNQQTLARIYKITEAVDQVYGVNHNQIDSIGHRTTRYLRAQSGGFLRAEPVMQGLPKSETDAAAIRRIVHNTGSVYGILVSLDDRAALVRANFIEGRLDHRRTFTDINERVIAPFEKGWIGALIKGRDASKNADEVSPAIVEMVFRGTSAADAGLKTGDLIEAANGVATPDRAALAAEVAKHAPGEAVTLKVKRGDKSEDIKVTVPKPDIKIFVAGEPRLYGYVYSYANDVFWIFTVTYCLEWMLRWMYFHDWRGALRPTLTGVIAAFWGLGFVHLIGFALDPLTLVMPFLITARAVSHAIQMHDRYYEEYERLHWNQRKAIVASFAELFVPTFSGIMTDAFGVLVIMLVPVVMLRKLAIVASFWILAITVAELLLNPIVYFYLREPDPEVVKQRDRGWYRRVIERFSDWNLSPFGKMFTMAFWSVLFAIGLFLMRGLIVGDPTAASPLVWADSPYNVSHAHIQEKFGGVEPLIVVAEGRDKDAMKDPGVLHSMEAFQRYLERDPDVGYSFSLGDILRSVNSVFHELEPKWGVIPNTLRDVGQTFFVFFANSPPTETAKYVTPDYKSAHVTFYCRNHKGENIHRIIRRCNEFIGAKARVDLGFEVEEGAKGITVSKVMPDSLAAKYELKVGDVIKDAEPDPPLPVEGLASMLAFGDHSVKSLHELDERLREAVADPSESSRLIATRILVERDGQPVTVRIAEPPSKAAFRLAGGLIGVLAAANEELVRNDMLMNLLGFGTMYLIVLFTYRSLSAGLYLLFPLVISNVLVNATMAVLGIGININTLPLVTVGLGFGIDYGLYIMSRIIEEIRVRGDLDESIREALVTSGKSVSFTAICMVASTAIWGFSNIRFDAIMGVLLAGWMFVSFVASETILPVTIALFRPKFILAEAAKGSRRTALQQKAAAR